MTVGNVAIDKDIAYWQQVLFFKVTSIDKIEIPGIKFVQEIHEDSPANGSNEYYNQQSSPEIVNSSDGGIDKNY